MQQDTSEQSEATDEIVVDDIAATNAEAAETAAESAESAADVPGAARQRSRPPAAGLGVAAAVGLGVAAVALLGGRRRGPSLREGESIQMSVHPRRVVWRYLTTLGMWEAARRNTRFTLTDERAIIEDGIVSRRMRSAPLFGDQGREPAHRPVAGLRRHRDRRPGRHEAHRDRPTALARRPRGRGARDGRLARRALTRRLSPGC